MTKIAALQQQLEKAARAAIPQIKKQTKADILRPPSRRGKILVGGWLPRDFKTSVRLVQAQTGETTQEIIARALNELFRAHKVPVVDNS